MTKASAGLAQMRARRNGLQRPVVAAPRMCYFARGTSELQVQHSAPLTVEVHFTAPKPPNLFRRS